MMKYVQLPQCQVCWVWQRLNQDKFCSPWKHFALFIETNCCRCRPLQKKIWMPSSWDHQWSGKKPSSTLCGISVHYHSCSGTHWVAWSCVAVIVFKLVGWKSWLVAVAWHRLLWQKKKKKSWAGLNFLAAEVCRVFVCMFWVKKKQKKKTAVVLNHTRFDVNAARILSTKELHAKVWCVSL